jgi:hypothetical protein
MLGKKNLITEVYYSEPKKKIQIQKQIMKERTKIKREKKYNNHYWLHNKQ